MEDTWHVVVRIKKQSQAVLEPEGEIAKRIVVFHRVLKRLDNDWPYAGGGWGSVVCSKCGGLEYRLPALSPAVIKEMAARVGVKVKIVWWKKACEGTKTALTMESKWMMLGRPEAGSLSLMGMTARCSRHGCFMPIAYGGAVLCGIHMAEEAQAVRETMGEVGHD